MISGWVRGLSDRDIEAALGEVPGAEAALSRSTVSRICSAIKDEFAAWVHLLLLSDPRDAKRRGRWRPDATGPPSVSDERRATRQPVPLCSLPRGPGSLIADVDAAALAAVPEWDHTDDPLELANLTY